jgi:serine/threonine protein kinase
VPNRTKDFRGIKTLRILGKGPFGVVKLVEHPSAHSLIAVKYFDNVSASGSEAFFREIASLIELRHPCVVRIVGYYLATKTSAAQIGTDFASRGSPRESATMLDDTENAIVLAEFSWA